MNKLLNELRRRNLFRIAGVYAVVGWLLMQVAGTLENSLHLPDWFDSAVTAALLLGFPIAILLGWAFEMTPEGMKRTQAPAGEESLPPKPARTPDYVIIAALILVAALVIWQEARTPSTSARPDRPAPQNQVAENPQPDLEADARSGEARSVPSIPAIDMSKSIAVLPFADFSPDKDQEWFSDGLAEEILNALARTPDLLVSSRTSSFKFKNTNEEIPTIAKTLGVAHVLEGSVRRGGNRLRVTAQLIRASDGFHVWSQTYDSRSDDVIAIQEDMAVKIATALKTAMDPVALANMARAGTRSVAAYEAYLQGLALLGQGSNEKAAYPTFERARALDPGFADAHFQASVYWSTNLRPNYAYAENVDAVDHNYSQYLARIDAAISAAKGTTRQLRYRANKALFQFRLAEAAQYLQQYLQDAPLDFYAWIDLSDVGSFQAEFDMARAATMEAEKLIGDDVLKAETVINTFFWNKDYASAARVSRRVLPQHPNSLDVLYQAHRALLWAGETDEARALIPRLQGSLLDERNRKPMITLRQACADGDRAKAEKVADSIFARVGANEAGLKWIARHLLGDRQAAVQELAKFDRANPPVLLANFLSYSYFDVAQYPYLREILRRQNITRPPVATIPFACPPATAVND